MSESTQATAGDVHITRVLRAPQQLVFDCFAQEEHLLHWFGPRSFPLVEWKHDFRPGGSLEYAMEGPNGERAPGKGEYLEIDEPSRIVSRSWIEHEGRVIYEVRQTMTFGDNGDGTTTFTLAHEVQLNDGFPGAEGAQQGWSETLDKLGEYLDRIA